MNKNVDFVKDLFFYLMSTKSKHSLMCNSKIASMLYRAHSLHRPVTGILHLNFLSNLVKQTFRVPALKGYWMSIVRQTHLSILHQTCSILNQIYLTRLINILWNVWAGQEGGWKWWPHFLESTIMTFLELCLSLQRAGTAYDLYREYQNHWPSGRGHTHTHKRTHMLAGKSLVVTKNTNRFGLTRLLLLCFPCCPGYKQTGTLACLVCIPNPTTERAG